ncbi:hypothetical protein [Yoonia sp. R2-816]|uniref:hypothetical protein n=1 Tax=Yoonia sp. R2-816 TaxID=3342638 RepID=UPI003726A678
MKGHYVLLGADLSKFLVENDFSVSDLVKKADSAVEIEVAPNPETQTSPRKEPATIILASAAVVAALTPLLIEVIRNVSRREAVIREKRLVPVEDSNGNHMNDGEGNPILHWVDVVVQDDPGARKQSISVKGFGIEIEFS